VLCFVLIMEATTSPLASQVTPAWLARCATACATQLNRDVAPIYGGTYAVRVGAGPTDIRPGEIAFSIVDSLPAAPGAVAYHDTSGNDVPVAFLALSTCNTLDDVSTAVSHEMCETAGDPSCNTWSDDGQGHEWAYELCDAIESNSYSVDDGQGGTIPVSDFLLPSFFGAGAPAPYTFVQSQATSFQANVAGYPSAPFAVATGGYEIQRTSGSGETQITGEVRALRKEKVAHWSSHASRRGVRLAA
jgi:hypothetical protein